MLFRFEIFTHKKYYLNRQLGGIARERERDRETHREINYREKTVIFDSSNCHTLSYSRCTCTSNIPSHLKSRHPTENCRHITKEACPRTFIWIRRTSKPPIISDL
jgi:hypothetical protein